MGAKRIFLIGAGRSSTSLIDYLLGNAEEHDWSLVVGDTSFELAKSKVKDNNRGDSIQFDVFNTDQLNNQVEKADLVISMLPANLHHYVAKVCLNFAKPMLTASYISNEISAMDQEARDKEVFILMECGLDPGIDHMSAKLEIDRISKEGGKLLSFKSFTGGLVAPESDDNPWNYKFTWNPRNVVLAGQGVVKFIRNGKYKYIPYNSLFTRLEKVMVTGYGEFEGYANRDSLRYREIYDIKDIPTLFRGTLRRPGFSKAWNVFVRLGLTDDTYTMEDTDQMTYRDYINSFLVYSPTDNVETKLANYLGVEVDSEVMKKIEWLGLFGDTRVGIKNATPAQVLQKCLEEKWQLKPDDRDMIVMQHQFEYEQKGGLKGKTTSLVVKGDNATSTSMARTVGLPLGIAAKLILTNKIKLTGVHTPTKEEIYVPILRELEEQFDIAFFEG